MEVLPDPGNALSGYKYLLQEAARGMFGETSDLLVAMYLWTHAWRKEPNADGFPAGWVQSGHTSASVIARGTMLDRMTVCRSLERLRERAWIETEPVDPGNWRRGQNIWVRIDAESHRERYAAVCRVPTSYRHDAYSSPDLSSLIYKEQVDGEIDSHLNETSGRS